MKVVIFKTNEEPKVANIKNDLKSFQEIVKGNIEVVYPFEDKRLVLICNESGKIDKLPMNRIVSNNELTMIKNENALFIHNKNDDVTDIICGDFVVSQVLPGDDDFSDLTEEQIRFLLNKEEDLIKNIIPSSLIDEFYTLKEHYALTSKYIEKYSIKGRLLGEVRCNRCGFPLILTEIDSYVYQCPKCDEDKYDIESVKGGSPITKEELEELFDAVNSEVGLD